MVVIADAGTDGDHLGYLDCWLDKSERSPQSSCLSACVSRGCAQAG